LAGAAIMLSFKTKQKKLGNACGDSEKKSEMIVNQTLGFKEGDLTLVCKELFFM
jgi:hypothetical protein